MYQANDDTIVAVATPSGRGGIGVVRISGPAVTTIAFSLLGKIPPPRQAVLSPFKDQAGEALDSGIALFFPGPASFTGEDILELHGHGGPVPMDMLVQRCAALGARLAEAGEFSKRAFLNGKIDLTQAEAISDLIDSASQQAARAAVRSLSGEFAKQLNQLVRQLTELRMYVEAAIDFPEEEIDFLADNELKRRLAEVEETFNQVKRDAVQGQLLRDGMILVIAGRPNVGKSSLLNSLAGFDAAIVTPQAGTTRDVIREDIHIDGMPLHIIDTAGLHDSDDPIEIEGMKRARAALSNADHILLMSDTRSADIDHTLLADLPQNVPVTRVVNKIDLDKREAGVDTTQTHATVNISALHGDGIQQLRDYLRELMGFSSVDSGKIIARRRHLLALEQAHAHMLEGKEALMVHKAGEIMAEELRLSQQSLGEITGRFTSDDLLGEIFSSFCIGK